MNMFRRERAPAQTPAQTPAVPPRPSPQDLENPVTHSKDQQDAVTTTTQRSGVLGAMQKVNPFRSSSAQVDPLRSSSAQVDPLRSSSAQVDPLRSSSAQPGVSKAPSSESLEDNAARSAQNPGVFKGVMQKVNPFRSTTTTQTDTTSDSAGAEPVTAKPSPGVMSGMMQKVNPFKSSSQAPMNDSNRILTEAHSTGDATQTKPNPGVFSGMIQKVNPFKSSQQKDSKRLHGDLSGSEGSLADNNNRQDKKASNEKLPTPTPELPPRPRQQVSLEDDQTPVLPPRPGQQGVFRGLMQKVNPFKSSSAQAAECQTDSRQPSAHTKTVRDLESDSSSSSESLNDETIQPHSVWYADAATAEVQGQPEEEKKKRTMTFRIKRILPTALFGSATHNSAATAQAQPEEAVEAVEVQTLEFADVNSEGTNLDPLDDEDGLMSWWNTVEGWHEWNESTQDAETEDVVEQAADRVFMSARLFVRLFNRRGGSLQQKILELLSLADAADDFHKKTVKVSVGGGVASVVGSVTTITGLILAPFTAGTSLIVTAVGIGVATAGGVTSASANITDTVHSKTDRKKVEQMIQGYQDEIKDIKDCLDFLQEGMEALEEWNFEQYAEAIAAKHLNQNMKHVMKEGGRAGKALVINTESLISTVQVLSAAGGAAKAAQVMSVTTGVMSGLFLALDVFFLAKDSMELRKGAKTDFAAKIRDVCKDLQGGLLELNRVKADLQRTMDGIEVEVEEEEEDEELLKSDLKKLIELEE